MLRTIVSLIMLCLCSSIHAQTWQCDSLGKSIKIFNSLSEKNNNKWAMSLKQIFPLNKDNEIEITYILTCSDSIPRMELVALTEGWLATVFTTPTNLIEVSNQDQLVCKGDLGQVAFDQKFIGATRILAPLEIRVLYKDNRVRLSLFTKNYRMAYANIGQLESGVISISETYPFNEKSKHKGAYSMAFINTISKLLNLANGYVSYLNKHSEDSKIDIPEW